MVLLDSLSEKHITVWSRVAITNVCALFGLALMITSASTLTQVYTDGKIHVSWSIPDSGDQPGPKTNDETNGKSVNSSKVPFRIPENVTFCEYGENGLEVAMPGVIVNRTGTDTVIHFMKACEKLISERDAHRKLNQCRLREKREFNFQIIYPGTKWCGTGDDASGYDDLGRLEEVDKCCRAHDHCPDYFLAGEERGGIRNDRGYTLLSCTCDEEFRKCLHGINDFDANTVGFTYFNLLDNECFGPASGNGEQQLQLIESKPYVPCFKSGFFRGIFMNRDC